MNGVAYAYNNAQSRSLITWHLCRCLGNVVLPHLSMAVSSHAGGIQGEQKDIKQAKNYILM